MQFFGQFEETFGGYGEEFGWVCGAISIQKSITIAGNLPLQLLVVFLEDTGPGDKGRGAVKDRGAIAFAGGAIELVREFVKDDIVAIVDVGGASADIVPGEND